MSSREFDEIPDSLKGISEEQQIIFAKVMVRFPLDEKTLEVIILKAHLIMEEVIRTLITEHVQFPKAVDEARLNCSQAINISEALLRNRTEEPWIWMAAHKLNKIRNHMAHNLEPEGLDDRIEDIISYIDVNFSQRQDNKDKHEGMDTLSRFRINMFLLLILFFELSKRKPELLEVEF